MSLVEISTVSALPPQDKERYRYTVALSGGGFCITSKLSPNFTGLIEPQLLSKKMHTKKERIKKRRLVRFMRFFLAAWYIAYPPKSMNSSHTDSIKSFLGRSHSFRRQNHLTRKLCVMPGLSPYLSIIWLYVHQGLTVTICSVSDPFGAFGVSMNVELDVCLSYEVFHPP